MAQARKSVKNYTGAHALVWQVKLCAVGFGAASLVYMFPSAAICKGVISCAQGRQDVWWQSWVSWLPSI